MKKQLVRILAALFVIIVLTSVLAVQAFADGTVTPTTGISVQATTATSGPTLSNGTVTITRKGGTFNSSTCNITITNTGGKTAKISFQYAHSGSGSATLNGTSVTSGTYSGTLDANGTVSMTLLGAGGWKTGTLTLSNFSWIEVSADAAATVIYDSTKGSVSLGGSAVSSGGSATATGGTLAAVATPASGCSFVGWVNADTHESLSTSASATLNVPQNMNIQAVFVNSTSDTAWFLVDDKYLTDDLNYASQTLGIKIVLMNNGTLAAGTYTIQSGDTLLIPYDSANTLITDDMGDHVNENYSSPPAKTLYRQLTMPSGTSITVNGAISVGSQALNLMLGQVGPYGCIVMDEGSNITVKSGGNLYAYGYIFYGEGSGGTVTVESGANVYESAFAMDYPGNVSNTKELTDAAVFPLRNVTFRNVEVPMTLYSGATEKVFYCVYGTTLGGNLPGYISLIGNTTSNAFCLDTGATMTKSYSDGMQYFTVNGNVSVNSLDISMTYLVFDYDANTSETSGFPIASNYDITVANGTLTLNDNLICYEGSKFTVDENATVNIGSKNIYVLDAVDDPGAMYAEGESTAVWDACVDVHGTQYGRQDTDAVWVINGKVSVGSGGFYTSTGKAEIISTGNGKVVFSSSAVDSPTVKIRYGRGYINEGNAGYESVSVTSAYLLNSDGSYTSTSDSSSATYQYVDGFWHKDCDGSKEITIVDATCTEDGSKTTKCTCGIINTTESITATGHTPNADDGDCTTAITCSVCDAVTTAAKTHVFDNDSDATCNNTGCKYTREVATYSVTITWSQTSTATYTPGTTTYTWSPSDLKYTASTTEGSWNNTQTVMTITIDNSGSTGAVTATFTYSPSVAATQSWTGLTDNALAVAAKGSGEATLTLTPSGTPTAPTDGTDTIILGVITITLTKGG